MKKVLIALALLALALSLPTAAECQVWSTGSTTHSAVATPYSGTELFAANTTGNAVASQVLLTVLPGKALAVKAMMESSGTNQPPPIILWLFASPPTTTGLMDRSPYLGPYAADFSGVGYIGSLTCQAWAKTNDGTAQYYSECAGSGLMLNVLPALSGRVNTTPIYVLEEINGSYTPLASEKHSYFIAVVPGQ